MIRFLAVLCMLIAVPVMAETVQVRSGEHDDFSRLVFHFDDPVDWRIDQTGAKAKIVLDRANQTFDLSKVFTYIPKTRLADISADDGVIALALACDCVVEGFRAGPNALAIDIRNATEATQRKPPPVSQNRAAHARSSSGQRPVLHPYGDFLAAKDRAQAGGAVRATSDGTVLEGGAETRAFESALVQQLGRAASQGLLTPKVSPAGHTPSRATKAEQPAPAKDYRSTDIKDAPDPAVRSHQIETAFDKGMLQDGGQPETQDGDPCLPAAYVAISEWSDGAEPAALIAHHRATLLSDIDQVTVQGVQSLAKAYLYLGFGAEANTVLNTAPADDEQTGVLRAMARIMDDERPVDAPLLANELACASPVALWAALSLEKLPHGTAINTDAIQLEFSQLPIHLRRHLGPRLAERFIAIGDREMATRIRNAITRAPGEHGDAFKMMDARLEQAAGQDGRLDTALKTVAHNNSPTAHLALAELLEMQVKEGTAPTADTLEYAEALAFELRDTALGQRLAKGAALGRAMSGHFDAALRGASELEGSDTQEVLSRVFEQMARTAADDELLSRAFAQLEKGDHETLSAQARHAMAERLLVLGFAEQAARFLGQQADRETDPVLKARIDLALGHPDQALGVLAPLNTVAAAQLRTQAYATKRDWSRVLQGAAGEGEGGGVAAWQSGAWDKVLAINSGGKRTIAARRLGRLDQDPDTQQPRPPTIAGAQLVMTASQELRNAVQDLLIQDVDEP